MSHRYRTMKMKRKYVEIIFLAVIFTVFLWAASGRINQHKLVHEYPLGHYASDNFWNLLYAESTYDFGHYKYRPSYVAYGQENIYEILPPLIFINPAMISYVSGQHPFFSLILFITIIYSLVPIVAYLIIRRYNREIAVLGLSFSAFLLSNVGYTSVTWGKYGTISGIFIY